MDSFELNKVLGALLGTVFVVFSISLVSDAIFATHSPETPGFAIEVSEEVAGGAAEDIALLDEIDGRQKRSFQGLDLSGASISSMANP